MFFNGGARLCHVPEMVIMWIGNLETEDVRTPCIDGIKVTTDMV